MTSKSVALSFSVGMRVTLIVVNAIVGFTAILLMTGRCACEQAAEADREGGGDAGSDSSLGRPLGTSGERPSRSLDAPSYDRP